MSGSGEPRILAWEGRRILVGGGGGRMLVGGGGVWVGGRLEAYEHTQCHTNGVWGASSQCWRISSRDAARNPATRPRQKGHVAVPRE